jgi:hypothetical protein
VADPAACAANDEEAAVRYRIGVTGHVHVSADVARWVAGALTERLRRLPDQSLRGVTCLAEGADQIFAAVVLALEGTIDVVLPARDYARRMAGTPNAATFGDLLRRARSVETMPFETSSRAAYLAASEAMLHRCDLLLAVWDGEPSRDVGDTADVVAKAREQRVPVEVLWPPGATRVRPPRAPGSPVAGSPVARPPVARPSVAPGPG